MTVLAFAPAVVVLAGQLVVPAWLDRVLPHMDVEGAGAEETPVAAFDPTVAP